jgi:hypothetical protein
MRNQCLFALFLRASVGSFFFMPIAVAQAAAADMASVETLKTAVLEATAYEASAVKLTASKIRLIVTIVNSMLNDATGTQRDEEATLIVSTITRYMADKPEFKGIQAMHIDYVRQKPGTTQTDVIDGIDFRKGMNGIFQKHIT